MIAFIIKSGLCMILFFGLYWLLLRKEKMFMFNRYYLIFSVLFSLAIPFVSIPVVTGYKFEKATDIAELLNPATGQESSGDLAVSPQTEKPMPATVEINSGSEPGVTHHTKGSRKVLFLVYSSGLMLMLLRFLRNLFIVNRMFRRSEKIDNDWYRIALLERPVDPFSFLRIVFLYKQDYLQDRISANVLMHELEHVRQAHSCDIIFFEILHMIFWFNPVLLLFKRAARINHEYLADEAVIRSSPDMRDYAGELINFISRRRDVTFASGFSPSMVRLRLLMLNSNTTRRGKTTRVAATLLTSFLLMSFLSIRPEQPGENSDNSAGPAKNKNIVIEEVQFRGPDFSPLKSLVIFNGRELDSDDIISVDPQQIKAIDILKNRKAVRRYGKNAKDGAVEIITYDYGKRSVPDSLKFKSIYTVNDRLPEGTINIPVSNLRSIKIWNYPILPNQAITQHWRTVEIMTRDFYRISGKVFQKNGEPVPGALVKASGNPAQVRTDSEGRFLLEDVNLGAMAELTAEGFEPLSFKATDIVFRSEISMTLDNRNDPDPDMIIANAGSEMRDLSGTWKLNSELSRLRWPVIREMIDIHQYDSDSILINSIMSFGDGEKRERKESYVFNTAKKTSYPESNFKSVFMCKIAADGQSFSLSHINRSIIETMRRYQGTKRFTTYSLNDEGKHLIVREFSFREDSSDTAEEVQLLVFDRM
jgi:hypothetical protein